MIAITRQNQLPNRQLVGYVRSYGSTYSCEVQTNLIQAYCNQEGLSCDSIYVDLSSHDRLRSECSQAEELGLPTLRWFAVHSEYEKLLLDIKQGLIGTILVDTPLRLEGSNIENEVLHKLCTEHDVAIIPVSFQRDEPDGKELNMAVYHFTDGSQIRPSTPSIVLDKLYAFALSENFFIPDLYFDRSLKKSKRTEWKELLHNINRYQIVLVTSFYHMEMKAITFARFACRYAGKVRLQSLEEGEIKLFDEALLHRELNVAFYNQYHNPHEKEMSEISLKKIQTFINNKAQGWILSQCYIDDGTGELVEMQRLIEESSKYDLLVIESFRKLGDRTNALMKLWKQIGGIPILSIEEGGLMLCES